MWCFDGRRGQGGGVGLFMYALMFNYRPQCLPPSLFFPSSLLRLSQTEPESDSCDKSLMEPGSYQKGSGMAWESMWASSSLDNTSSGYQTRSMPCNVRWRHLGSDWVSWEWHDLTGLFQCTQTASIKTARSLRQRLHGFDLQWAVPAIIQGSVQVGETINPQYCTFYHVAGVR